MEGGSAKIFQESIFINVNSVLLLNHPKGLAGGKIDSVKGEGRHPHTKISIVVAEMEIRYRNCLSASVPHFLG